MDNFSFKIKLFKLMVLPERALDKSVLRTHSIIKFKTICLMKKLDNVASNSLYSCCCCLPQSVHLFSPGFLGLKSLTP